MPATQLDRARTILSRLPSWRYKKTELRDFNFCPVLALYFSTQRQLYNAREMLTAADIPIYETDINPIDRFLMERFITGAVQMEVTVTSTTRFIDIENPRVTATQYRPRLKCVSLDIETDYAGKQLYSIAVFSDTASQVFMVGNPTDVHAEERCVVKILKDERAVLENFLQWLDEHDPDVVIGWNVINFDLRVLQLCCDRLGIEFRLGRNRELVGWRKSRDANNRYFATVPGRVVLDGIELMRSATYQFENFSLDNVAQELLGRGKLIDDVDQRGAEITRLFNENKLQLAQYNLEDCRLVWEIFAKENLLAFATERSLLTGLELNRYGGSVAAFDFLYLPRLHRAGFVAPAPTGQNSRNMSPGGYVMDSQPGIYDHVIVLDFKSLYPSIIRTFHVDPLALLIGLQEDDAIPGFDGGKFSRRQFLLPTLIESLWQARDRAKLAGNRTLSQAIKIIMNSFYGVLGTSGCRFLDSRLVSSITRRGHQIIVDSKEFIEQCGYRVIYGDTDSLFVLVGMQNEASVDEIGRSLSISLNHWWKEKLQRTFNLESCLEIEFETHFSKFLMPTVRGSDTGSKKRYAGLIRSTGNNSQAYQLLFKGLETVRSDWSPLARKFQQELYEKVFLDQPYEEYIKETIDNVMKGELYSELVLRRRIRRRLDDYVKNVPPHVQAARKAEAIRKTKGLPSLYADGGWVEYLMTINGPEPKLYRQSAIDKEFYIERQITPIADSILVFKSSSVKELMDQQIGLF